MTEDLDQLFRAAQGEPPSDEFRQRLRAEIVAASDGTVGQAAQVRDLEVAVDFEVHPHDKRIVAVRRPVGSRRLQLLAVVAAIAVPLVGIWAWSLSTGDTEELETLGVPSTVEAPATPLTASQLVPGAGRYRVDTLGTAFTLDVDETTAVGVNENGVVSFSDVTSRNANHLTITLWRTSLLPDQASLSNVVDPATGWPATDVEGWLDVLEDSVLASAVVDTALGGAKASSVALEFPCRETSCATDDSSMNRDLPVFAPGSRFQMFMVDQGVEEAIVVIVAIGDADDSWLSNADAILSSLVFESTEPSPVRRAAMGAVELDVFGGVSVQIGDDVAVVDPYDGFARLTPADLGGDVELFTRPLDTNGEEVMSITRLLQLLDDEAVALNDVGRAEIDGIEGRAFEVEAGDFPNVVLNLRPADLARSEFGWEPPRFGHLWVFEHPDRGLLVVSSDALEGPSAVDPLRQWTEDLLPSLEFREP